jgi:hypothetical protein
MKKLTQMAFLSAIVLFSAHAALASGADADVIAHLKDAKISLLDGIAYAERTSGPTTSAKFEMDGNDLSLSIYTAPQGLDTPAEANDLTELSGSPAVAAFAPKAEVFADKEHIARASVHLAIQQMSKLTLTQFIQKGLRVQSGTPYSVANPEIRNRQPVADVFIADSQNNSVKVTINVRTGKVVCY